MVFLLSPHEVAHVDRLLSRSPEMPHAPLGYTHHLTAFMLVHDQQAVLFHLAAESRNYFKSQHTGSYETHCGQTQRETKTFHCFILGSLPLVLPSPCLHIYSNILCKSLGVSYPWVNYTEHMLLKHIYRN